MKSLQSEITFVALLMIMASCTAIRKQAGCKGCDMATVAAISSGLDKQSLQHLFCSIQTDCIKTNIEFSEAANEAVFDAIDKEPALFLEVFDGAKVEKQRLVLGLLASPVHDLIDVKSLSNKVVQVNAYPSSKAQVLSALAEAGGKR